MWRHLGPSASEWLSLQSEEGWEVVWSSPVERMQWILRNWNCNWAGLAHYRTISSPGMVFRWQFRNVNYQWDKQPVKYLSLLPVSGHSKYRLKTTLSNNTMYFKIKRRFYLTYSERVFIICVLIIYFDFIFTIKASGFCKCLAKDCQEKTKKGYGGIRKLWLPT